MSAKETKVSRFGSGAVRERIVEVFKKRRGEATVQDLVAVTGLPLDQVASGIPEVADEFGARMKVTESGEILYSFPDGMKSRYRGFGPTMKRFFKAFGKGAAEVGKLLFKGWIVFMLVGYFVFFIALAVLAIVASIAASTAGSSDSRSSRRGGGLGGLWLTGRIFDTIIRIWFYSELFKSPQERAYRGYRRGESDKADRRPLHKAVFSHVFGDGDPNANWDEIEKRAVVAFIQSNRGILSMPEFIAITGLSPAEADRAINRYLAEFKGEPEVTEGGTIIFRFEDLLRRKDRTDRTFGFSVPLKRLEQFSSNAPKADRTFRLLNLANLLFGSYFLYGAIAVGGGWFLETARGLVLRGGFDFLYSFTAYLFGGMLGIPRVGAFIGTFLGVAPLAFSVLFFLIPVLRSGIVASRNEKAKFENLRKVLYRALWDRPYGFRAESVPAGGPETTPSQPAKVTASVIDEAAAWAGAEPEADGSWDFASLARDRNEVKKARDAVDMSRYELGGTVFDSHA